MTSYASSRDLTFILGGARSGKSAHAEQLAAASGMAVTYVATARIGDAEFAERMRTTGAAAGGWSLLEAPLDLAGALRSVDREGHCVLIDCLTLWLANLLCPADAARARPPPRTKPSVPFSPRSPRRAARSSW